MVHEQRTETRIMNTEIYLAPADENSKDENEQGKSGRLAQTYWLLI